MKFTGKNLVLVEYSLRLAADEIQGQIGSCPDVFHYEAELKELEDDLAQIKKLHAKVLKHFDTAPEPT